MASISSGLSLTPYLLAFLKFKAKIDYPFFKKL